MSAQTQTADISHTIIDVPVIPDEIPLDVETQRASELVLKELDSDEEAKFHIAPLGLNNFLYNAAHLFLPYFYSSRAYVVLSSATLTEEEIKSQFTEAASKDSGITLEHWPDVKKSWNQFLDSLSNEWKTLNLVSALLLTAIYNVLQLRGRGNRLIQCTALMSLLSALMSLLFGCLYLIRFETMRRTYKAIQWSSDVLKTSQIVFWNIYILLALPSVWLAWSLIFFVICLMSIVWQPTDETIGSTGGGLGPLHLATKITVSALLFVGMAHLSLALFTFARYGSRLDKTWTKKLESFSGAIRPESEAKTWSSSFENSRPTYSHLLSSPYSSPAWPSPYTAMVGGPYRRPPYSSTYWPLPYVTRVGKPFDNSRPPYSHLQSSPYSSPFSVGRPFDNNRPPYPHLPSSPYWPSDTRPPNNSRPFNDSRPPNDSRPINNSEHLNNSGPVDNTSNRPFDNSRPPYSHLQSSPYSSPFWVGRPFDNNRPPYSHLPSSPYWPSDTRPPNNSRPFNDSRPPNDSRPIKNSEHLNNSGPVDNTSNGPFANSRPFNYSDNNNGRTLNSTIPRPGTRIGPVRYNDFITRPPSAP
ncbi:hypothetical protein M378DRAFT_7839 [Amanita muscaria Koide BX008]|uniref:Uncharacterized protein n=1 Tax=Amanita muscaria (strain Koide BX008) TaxID=946122 RepID=A0A0C2T008_AMAMK|nr:hypothetical protein M378DRAFT_7839 [Amanita muscaria Koide BX008]